MDRNNKNQRLLAPSTKCYNTKIIVAKNNRLKPLNAALRKHKLYTLCSNVLFHWRLVLVLVISLALNGTIFFFPTDAYSKLTQIKGPKSHARKRDASMLSTQECWASFPKLPILSGQSKWYHSLTKRTQSLVKR